MFVNKLTFFFPKRPSVDYLELICLVYFDVVIVYFSEVAFQAYVSLRILRNNKQEKKS